MKLAIGLGITLLLVASGSYVWIGNLNDEIAILKGNAIVLESEITKQNAPNFAATLTRGEEGGKASMVTANSELRLTPVNGEQTEVYYKSEVSIVGRLGKFGLGIMKKKAKTIGEEFAENFRTRIET